MMKTFDIRSLKAFPFKERDKNVFYKANEFKMRIIELNANQELPGIRTCNIFNESHQSITPGRYSNQ